MVTNDEIRPAVRVGLGAVAGPLLGDLIAPVVVYYVAESLGASVVLGLALGGLSALPRQLLQVTRRRRLDGMGTTVLVAFALGVLLSLWTGSARTLVAKDAIWPFAAGLIVAGSCLRGKPVTFFLFRPMLTGGQVANRPFWDQVFLGGRAFRHCLRVLAVGWSAVLLTAGAAELVLAMSLPIDAAAAVPGLVSLVALPVLLGGTALYAKYTGMGVRRSLAEMSLRAAEDAR